MFTFKTIYSEFKNCYFKIDDNKSRRTVSIWSDEEGSICTINNVDAEILYGIEDKDLIAVKSYSENEGVEEFLKEHQLVPDTPEGYAHMGMAEYLIYRFAFDKAQGM